MYNPVRYFAGIGARRAPKEVLVDIFYYSQRLRKLGYVLRSGGADGCDTYFENGYLGFDDQKEIFKAKDVKPWAIEKVKNYLPEDYLPRGLVEFDNWGNHVKNLLGRNMQQLFGNDGGKPIDFIVCWTKSLNYPRSEVGGTGYALRCALDHKIPIYNLVDPKQRDLLEGLLEAQERSS